MMNLIFMRELKDWLKVIGKKRKIYKGVAANVVSTADFFTAFLIFRVSFILRFLNSSYYGLERRLEELINCGKIIRPAYEHFRKQGIC